MQSRIIGIGEGAFGVFTTVLVELSEQGFGVALRRLQGSQFTDREAGLMVLYGGKEENKIQYDVGNGDSSHRSFSICAIKAVPSTVIDSLTYFQVS